MKKLLVGILLVTCSVWSLAESVTLKKDRPDHYVVKKGDTLWDISSVFLDDPWLWPEIWHINPQVNNPHLIFPGDKLSLVYVGDEVKLTVTERAPVKVKAKPSMKPESKGSEIQKLTPQVRTDALEEAIPAIPLDKISPFLTKSRVVGFEVMDEAPYVLAGQKRHLLSGAGDQLYARGDFPEGENVYGVYRAGKTYVDPDSGETLGMQALEIGLTRIVARDGDVATLVVNESRSEIRINDRLLPSEQKRVTATFYPKSPDRQVKGTIFDVEGGVTQVGPLSIVAIDLGEIDGVVVGDVLAISKSGEIVRDRVENQVIQLPDTRAGLMIVFRAFEKMSFGFVLSSNQPLIVGDKVHNP